MAVERYVLLGLASARSTWFAAVGNWANSGSMPAEFVKCVSVEEVRARLASGRPFSALIADGGLAGVDRDLLSTAHRVGCAVVMVQDPRIARDWMALGADRLLVSDFDRAQLVEVLTGCARMIPRGDAAVETISEAGGATSSWRGLVIAVTGPGGTGASVSAIALAQGLADDVRQSANVLLADLRLNAEQAMLHDALDVVPGVQEMVEAHRSGCPGPREVAALTFAVVERRYQLLLGLRKATFWPAIRPRAFEAAFASLLSCHRAVVCDVDPDLEGEDVAGSLDVEERNVMARTAVEAADVVVVVGSPSMKGLHSIVRVIGAVTSFGVGPERIVAVLNRSGRGPRFQRKVSETLVELARPCLSATDAERDDHGGPARALGAVVHLPLCRMEEALRDGCRLPGAPST